MMDTIITKYKECFYYEYIIKVLVRAKNSITTETHACNLVSITQFQL